MEEVNKSRNIELKISEDHKIPGNHPIVIIGPNGSGKTRLGAKLSKENNAEWITAVRNLALGSTIGMRSTVEAKSQVLSHVNQLRERPWQIAGEFEILMSQLLAEDAESAKKYRNECFISSGNKPPETKVTKLVMFWNEQFPGRKINLDTYNPMVKSTLEGSEIEYPVMQMSDGERVAMYLAARVINAEKNIIIVDEPEVHFHSLLAKRFWNELEKIKSDCRFVYITHDLCFALSRRKSQYIIVEPGKKPKLLSSDTIFPEDIVENILGAATFSINAKQIVFCEGDVGGIDETLYSAWFQDEDIQVIPVGSCDKVIKSVDVFNSSQIIVGGNAIGIVDRDYWPDDYLGRLDEKIHVLKVHEVENLFCLEEVFKAIGKYLKISDGEITKKYGNFIQKAKNSFRETSYTKQILERAKKRKELGIKFLNNVSPEDNLDKVKLNFITAFGKDEPEKIFTEEQSIIDGAISGSNHGFLKFLPGKTFLTHAMDELGVKKERFIDILIQALLIPDENESDNELTTLKGDMISALENHLPIRKILLRSENKA